MKVDTLERLDDVGETAWEGLRRRASFPSPFLSWAWQTTWAAALGSGRPIRLLRVRDDAGELVGLLPLHHDTDGVWRIAGGRDVSDYLDLIAPDGSEEDVWTAVLESRAASGETWELQAIRAGSPTAALLPGLAPAWGLRVDRESEERCPVLDLPTTWDAYLARLSGKQRHELTRKMRRLERERPGASVTSAATAVALAGGLGEFLELHRRSRAGKARFMDERMEGFFRRAVGMLAARGMARLWTLRAGEPLAAYVCVEWPGTVGLYNSGFDPRAAPLSPGIVLLGHVIRDTIERGVARFDFLRGEEPYKLGFGARLQDLYRFRLSR